MSISAEVTSAVESPSNHRSEKQQRSATRAAIGANFVDQFDIFVPVIALAPANATLFGAENLAQSAGLVFVATLIGRPLGALFFGPIADRIGRRAISIVTLAGIALTTFAIALTQDHTAWGAWSLGWVIIMRFLGGVFLGGQYSAAIPLAMEWSSAKHRGTNSGLIMAASPVANASIAALTLVLLSTQGSEQYAHSGWRIPFLLAGALALAMLVIYVATVRDKPTTTRQKSGARTVIVGSHRFVFVRVFVLMSGLWLLTNMAIAVVTQQLTAHGAWNSGQVTQLMMWGTGASAVTMVVCGFLSTRTGRRRFFILAGLSILAIAPMSYLMIWQASQQWQVIVWIVALQVFTVSAYGPIGAHLSEQFPAHVRSTGYGLGYSLSIVVPALYPYYLPPLQEQFGPNAAVAGLIALGGVLVCVGGLLARDKVLEG